MHPKFHLDLFVHTTSNCIFVYMHTSWYNLTALCNTVYNLRHNHVYWTSKNVHFNLQNTKVLSQFMLKFYKVMCTESARICGIKQYISLSIILLIFFKHFEKCYDFRFFDVQYTWLWRRLYAVCKQVILLTFDSIVLKFWNIFCVINCHIGVKRGRSKF